MISKILMTVSAVFCGVLGLVLSFLPHETALFFGMEIDIALILSLQILGAAYLAFAMLNWMTKNNLMGGIYGRPLSIANFLHFFAGAMSLLRAMPNVTVQHTTLLVLTVIYALFATGFGYVFMTNPSRVSK